MVNEDIITPHSLEIYLKYKRLTARSFGEFVSGLGSIADLCAETYGRVVETKIPNLPTLEVEVVKTGESIKFKFGEGWLPCVTTDEQHDIIIDIPKKLGIPLLVGYLLLSAVKLPFDVYNSYLDSRLKQLDIILKQTEIRKVLHKDGVISNLQEKSMDVINIIKNNNDYEEFKIYEVDIISISKK